jgi:alkanesulfonate monooxygenase SsuD/methylene tetrahydromethanopterin reductase-like flavin-dependent oxidoreductase (luciferase family)
MSTLDHLSNGRVGWNIVTGYLDSAARNLGLARQLGHDQRYDLAEEYLQVLYKLWEKSWDDDAVLLERDSGRYIEPTRVHPINHVGEHFQVPGMHLCQPSPQRTPVLFQAGASARGQQFAARHAECVFISGPTPTVLRRYADGIRQASEAAGRGRDEVLIYAQALLIVAPTKEEAEARFAEYRRYVDLDAALALLSGWTGIDFAGLDPDAPIEYVENDAGRAALAAFTAADPNRRWTVREAAEFVGLGGRGPVLVGAASEVADRHRRFQPDLRRAAGRPGQRGRVAGARAATPRPLPVGLRRRHPAPQTVRPRRSAAGTARRTPGRHSAIKYRVFQHLICGWRALDPILLPHPLRRTGRCGSRHGERTTSRDCPCRTIRTSPPTVGTQLKPSC